MSDYRDDVKAIAQDCIDNYPDPDDDGRHDFIHESVDGSQWVIYYSRNEEVLSISRNEPDGREVQAMAGADADWRQLRTIAAYMAMEADVWEAVRELDEEREAYLCDECGKDRRKVDGPDCSEDDSLCVNCDAEQREDDAEQTEAQP